MSGKLVRDKIPQIIEAAGKKPNIRILSDDEYLYELDKKLFEEIEEYKADRSLEELADIFEVLLAHCYVCNFTYEDLQQAARLKREARGAFKQKIFWMGND
jgi:predicted house-cleaning noncanonical NTP pyrophosphatase (MazG superfamily)